MSDLSFRDVAVNLVTEHLERRVRAFQLPCKINSVEDRQHDTYVFADMALRIDALQNVSVVIPELVYQIRDNVVTSLSAFDADVAYNMNQFLQASYDHGRNT